jgi:outer membrane protein assembly factor BamD
VARYYFRRGAFVAASNRAQQVVLEFPQTPATEEALFLMQSSYRQLGLDALRDDTRRVLEKNFPDSRYLREGLSPSDKPWWQFW